MSNVEEVKKDMAPVTHDVDDCGSGEPHSGVDVESPSSLYEIEKKQAEKLKQKYPVSSIPINKLHLHTAYVQRRLSAGQYFDSADYFMAKAKTQKKLSNEKGVEDYEIDEVLLSQKVATPEQISKRRTSIGKPSRLSL